MSELEALEIEKSAVTFLKQIILPHKKMNDFINENDKEPSWDGMIYLYNEKGYKTEDILCRVPVQVKGKNDPTKLNNKGITYPVEYKHLRNYDKDGGVVYLVVYMSDDCSKYQVFYNCLTPVKLLDILKGTEKKNPEQKKNIPLVYLKKNDVNELYKILLQFDLDRKKQGSSKGQILRRSIDRNNIRYIDSISWSTYLTDQDEIMKNISLGEICLYGHDIVTDTWYPFSFEEQIKIKITKCVEMDRPFGVDGQFFYDKVIVRDDGNEQKICLSENLVINDTKKKFYFKPISTLDVILNDIMFIKALRYGKRISVGMSHLIDLGKITFPKAFLEYLDWWETLIVAFKEYDIKCTKRIDEFTDKDWENVNCLIKIYSNEISQDYKSDWWMMWWENRVYPIFIASRPEGEKRGYNLISSTDFWMTTLIDEERYIIPNFFMYKRYIWEKIYDFDENVVLMQLERCDYCKCIEGLYYQLFIELLSAYDKTQDEKLYNIAMFLANKFEETDSDNQYGIINKLQLLKRKRAFTDTEIAELEEIYQSPFDDLVACAVEILLENKYAAKKRMAAMPTEDQELFKEFPIYNLL